MKNIRRWKFPERFLGEPERKILVKIRMEIPRKLAAAGILLFVTALGAGLGGCGGKNQEAPGKTTEILGETTEISQGTAESPQETGHFSDGAYVLPGGLRNLPISENDWKVEEDDDGDLIFMNKRNKNLAFSASKWENVTLPPEADYWNYYEQYFLGILEEHPEAEQMSFRKPVIDGSMALYMGVRLQMEGEDYRVLMYLIPDSGGQDILSFTMTVPEAEAAASEREFRVIVEGMRQTDFVR